MLSLYTSGSMLEAYKNKLNSEGLTTSSFIKFTDTVQRYFDKYFINDALEYAPNSIEFCGELSAYLEELAEGLELSDEQQNQIQQFVKGKFGSFENFRIWDWVSKRHALCYGSG